MAIKHHIHRFGRHLKDTFIPHEGNNHQPHALKHRVLLGYSAVLILLKVLVVVVPLALPSLSLFSSAITSANIIDLTNTTRDSLGLGTLKTNSELAAAAQAKADDMVQNQYFAHVSPAGVTPWDWIQRSGYKYSYAGENLAVNFISAEGVQEGWMASPSHRANIVNTHYNDIGVGVGTGQYEGYTSTFVVEMFGSPQVSVASVPVTIPAVVTKPAPAPQPAQPSSQVAAAETKPAPAATSTTRPAQVTPVIYDDSLLAAPQGSTYHVAITVTGAQSVSVTLTGLTATLHLATNSQSRWEGNVPYDSAQLSQGGELVTIAAVSSSGQSVTHPLALVAPTTSTQQLYAFNDTPQKVVKFFGFLTVHNLDDSVRRFYLYFVVGLAAALLLNVFIKVRVQYASVISHTMLVMALALFLTIV